MPLLRSGVVGRGGSERGGELGRVLENEPEAAPAEGRAQQAWTMPFGCFSARNRQLSVTPTPPHFGSAVTRETQRLIMFGIWDD